MASGSLEQQYMKQRLALEKQLVEFQRLNTFVNLFNSVQSSMSEKDRMFWKDFLKGKLIELMKEDFPGKSSMTKRFRSMQV